MEIFIICNPLMLFVCWMYYPVFFGVIDCDWLRDQLHISLRIWGEIICFVVEFYEPKLILLILDDIKYGQVNVYFDFLVSNQARVPAELKHINKRRKRN